MHWLEFCEEEIEVEEGIKEIDPQWFENAERMEKIRVAKRVFESK